jgi:hypothetical protein
MSEENLKRLQVYAAELARGDLQVTVSFGEAGFLSVVAITKESGGSQPLSMKAAMKVSNLTEARQFIARVIEQARRAGAAR